MILKLFVPIYKFSVKTLWICPTQLLETHFHALKGLLYLFMLFYTQISLSQMQMNFHVCRDELLSSVASSFLHQKRSLNNDFKF